MPQTFFYQYKRQCIWLVFLAAVLTFFERPVHHFLNFLIVQPLFKDFFIKEGGKLFLIAILIGYVCWASKFLEKNVLYRVAIYSLGFYIFQRLKYQWEFYIFLEPNSSDSIISEFVRSITYWDLVELALVIPALVVIFQKEHVVAYLPEPSKGFVQDNPIELDADDSFGRNNVAKQIAEMIEVTDNRRSFAIGILGDYGSGKTSFLNLINKALPTDDYVTIHFNPWNSESPTSIHKDFFDLLINTVASIDPKVSSLLFAYARKISRVDLDLLKNKLSLIPLQIFNKNNLVSLGILKFYGKSLNAIR